ncbi:MAG: ABC transporter permease [Candidatus Adiutrix sp.]|jgi:phospholipid/cholesterol/gamma-HCH transport system permease protein|nr:ABC transporter permease [Candidatus Adiutrix sp.]
MPFRSSDMARARLTRKGRRTGGLAFEAACGRLGRLAINWLSRLADQAGFAGRIVILTWQGRRGRFGLMARLTLEEIFKQAFGAIGLIVLVGFMLGFLWSVLWYGTLGNIGGLENFSTFLISIHAIQIAPIMTTVIVILRYGAPSTWELAAMKSGRQFETLAQMGIPPEHYLAAPRIIGTALTMPALLMLFILSSCAGSYYLAWRFNGQALLEFLFALSNTARGYHFAIMAFKSAAVSLALSFFCVYNGFSINIDNLNGGALVIRRAMGESFFYCMLASVLISVLYV